MEKLAIKPNTTYVIGFYIQDFDKKQMVNQQTGEVTELSLHRVLLQCVGNIDCERWGVERGDFGGSGVTELKIPLAGISYVFGFAPDDPKFNLFNELKALLYCPVRLDYALDNKGRAKLRSIHVDKD